MKTSEQLRKSYEASKDGTCWESVIGKACRCAKHGTDAYMASLIARIESAEARGIN